MSPLSCASKHAKMFVSMPCFLKFVCFQAHHTPHAHTERPHPGVERVLLILVEWRNHNCLQFLSVLLLKDICIHNNCCDSVKAGKNIHQDGVSLKLTKVKSIIRTMWAQINRTWKSSKRSQFLFFFRPIFNTSLTHFFPSNMVQVKATDQKILTTKTHTLLHSHANPICSDLDNLIAKLRYSEWMFDFNNFLHV